MSKIPAQLDNGVLERITSGTLPVLRVKQGNLRYLSKNGLKLLISGPNEGGDETEDQSTESIPGLNSVSDLDPDKYEGGFKVWESTKDLLDSIYEEPNLVRGKSVLDIGCGAGLVGIACLQLGAVHVSFQDFNEEVLKWFTLPNIVLNLYQSMDKNSIPNSLQSRISLFSGDWSQIPIPENHFDIIVTAETIYNQDNYPKLASLIDKSIKNDVGKAIVGAKTHYFGVGGGTRTFEEFMTLNTSLKSNRVMKVIDSPVQREIILFER